MNKILIITLLGFLLVGSVSAASINYYFHPQCGHCKEIKPFINQVYNKYNNVNWNFLDISKGSYDILGTPTLEIHTNDGRKITLKGSYDIPKYLECELNEMSTLNCETYSYLNYETNSFFVR